MSNTRRLLQIGAAAREIGISVEWLRKLERDGVIPKAKRLMGCRRVYTQDDIDHIKAVILTRRAYRKGYARLLEEILKK